MRDSLKVTPKDEVRVIIALGILASILVYDQLKAGNIGLIASQPVTAPIYPVVAFLIVLELFMLSMYLLFLTVALGLDVFDMADRGKNLLKEFADIYFGIGAVLLLALAVAVYAYLEAASLATIPTTTSLSEPVVLVIAIALSLTFAYSVLAGRHMRRRATKERQE